MKTLARLLAAAAAVVPLAACVPGESVRPDLPPTDVGGRFSIAGLSFGPKGEPYGYEGELTPQEQELREQGRKFDRTVWEGALIGGVAGSIIGALVGGDAEDAVAGALIGGGVGALAGMYVAEKQKQYASAEDQLDAMIADVRTSNENTRGLIADARTVLEEDRRRLRALEARERQGQATKAELEQERARALANRKVVADAAAGARDQHEMFTGAQRTFAGNNPGTPTRALEEELEAFRQHIDQLDGVAESMARA